MTENDREHSVGDRPMGSADVGTTPPRVATVPLGERTPPALVFRWAVAGTLGVLAVLLAGYGLFVVRGILVLVLIALFVAISLEPAVHWLVNMGMRRSLAVAAIFLVVLVLFGLFIWSIGPPLVNQGTQLITDLPGYLSRLSEESRTVREVAERYNLTSQFSSLAASIPAKISGGAIGFAQRLFSALAATLTVLVLAIYFMAYMPRLRRGVTRLFPARRRLRVTEIVDVVIDKVGGYMIGNLIISLFAGVSTFVCLTLVGVPFALPLAVAVAIADLIPMIGATIGAVLGVVVSVFTAGIWPASIIVLLFFIAYQQLENYLIAPRVLRKNVDMSALAVLLVALSGGALLGLVGAVMAIPVAAAIKVILSPTIASMWEPSPPDRAGSAVKPAISQSDTSP